MEFFKTKTNIDFMRQRKWAALFSLVLFAGSLLSVWLKGLNLGLDFTGGTQFELVMPTPVDPNVLREQLAKAGFPESVVQLYGSVRDISIRVGQHKAFSSEQLKQRVLGILPAGVTIKSVDFIGSQVSSTLLSDGILAILVSLIATMIYIALRFEYRFAVSAAIALVHDPVLIMGLFSFFQIEFNLIVLAAVLTVIGYSLNDTIVVYDRVRENFRKIRKGSPTDIMNLSINQTLSRTIMTSGLTLLVVVVMFIFGGEVLHHFALALIIGIVIGTYSSIYVAGALAIAFGLDRNTLLPKVSKEMDARP